MRTICVHVRTNRQGSDDFEKIEVPDNATDEEIEELAKDAMFELINWHWEENQKDKK